MKCVPISCDSGVIRINKATLEFTMILVCSMRRGKTIPEEKNLLVNAVFKDVAGGVGFLTG